MAEYPLIVETIPGNTCYPPTVQLLLNLVAEYSTLVIPGNQTGYVISSTTPSAENQDKLWFQTGYSGSGYGSPKVVRLYINGAWLEFAQLSQGDRILVPSIYTISAPWGEFGYTYSFSDLGISSYTPTQAPIPPEGLKYKTYVGYWSSKTP
jgi:hypothetical protein